MSPELNVPADTSRCIQVSVSSEEIRAIVISINKGRTAQDLMHPAEDSELSTRRNMAGLGTDTVTEDVGKVRPTRREENTSRVVSSVALALEGAEARRTEQKVCATRAQPRKKLGMHSFAAVA